MTSPRDEAHVIAFEANGARARVTVAEPALLHRVVDLLPLGWSECAPSPVDRRFALATERDGRYALLIDDEVVFRHDGLDSALAVLESHVLEHVLVHAQDVVFVHAGAVGYRNRAILLPGSGMTGKSTLVAALVRAGADYYTDDYAPLDRNGRVHPYAIGIYLRDVENGLGERVPIESLGGAPGKDPLPVGVIAAVSYAPDARWTPRGCTSGEGALMLVANALGVEFRPEFGLAVARAAAATALVVKAERGDPDEAARALLELTGPRLPPV